MDTVEIKRDIVLNTYPSKVVPLQKAIYSKGEVTLDRTDFLIKDLSNLGCGTIKEFSEFLPDITFTYEGKNYRGGVEVTSKTLPEKCFVVLPANKEVVLVHRGVMGYSPTREGNQPWFGQETADYMNKKLGVTRGQAEAMFSGSMFGWNNDMANPNYYDDDGNWIKDKKEAE